MVDDGEALQVLRLAQALVGAVSPNLRRVSLEQRDPGEVGLHFLLEQDSEDDREEIEDVVFEFEAMQDSDIVIDVKVTVDAGPLERIHLPGRVVFGRKE